MGSTLIWGLVFVVLGLGATLAAFIAMARIARRRANSEIAKMNRVTALLDSIAS